MNVSFSYFKIRPNCSVSNFNLVKLVEIIGTKTTQKGYESNYKKGIKLIRQKILNKENIYINNRQIKRFLKINVAEGEIMKIPYSAHIIFKVITEIIDNDEDLQKKCIDRMKPVKNGLCKTYLINDFCKSVAIIIDDDNLSTSNILRNNMMNVINGFNYNNKICYQ